MGTEREIPLEWVNGGCLRKFWSRGQGITMTMDTLPQLIYAPVIDWPVLNNASALTVIESIGVVEWK